APNVRPLLDTEALDAAQTKLAQAFDLYKEERSQDFSTIAAMTTEGGVKPTAQSYRTVVQYLGKSERGNVLAVDVGSAASVLAVAVKGEAVTAIRSDLGLGHNAQNLLQAIPIAALRRWIPFEIDDAELQNYAANKTLRPATIPATLRDVYIEHALLRAAIQTLVTASRPAWTDRATHEFRLIIGGGAALEGVGHPAYSALLLLDALQPTGITQLRLDSFALIPALGSIAASHPDAVVQTLAGSSIESLATAFCVMGVPRLDKPALRVKITLNSGDVVEETVHGGHLWVYPLAIGQTAEVRVRVVGRGLSINGKARLRLNVTGGSAGLIFDVRGRPLMLADDVATRAEQMPVWIAEATGDVVRPIDPDWVQSLELPSVAAVSAPLSARSAPAKPAALDLAWLDDAFSLPDESDNDDDDRPVDELRDLRNASLS
ncbi:MAG: glutamate mutase L, partial [Armatimonadetes bacterium]|nr:glutamate mutase L [Anaerolineae bacterium]